MQHGHFKVIGKVQGVFFRKYTKIEADKLNLNGWIRNDESGEFVEGDFSGTVEDVQKFIQFLHKGPRKAIVAKVIISENNNPPFTDFQIIR